MNLEIKVASLENKISELKEYQIVRNIKELRYCNLTQLKSLKNKLEKGIKLVFEEIKLRSSEYSQDSKEPSDAPKTLDD